MTSGPDSIRSLNAWTDSTYKPVAKMIDAYQPKRQDKKQDVWTANCLRLIFGRTCDPDDLGREFELRKTATCPKCQSQKMADWEIVYPAYYVEMDIPPVTHHAWEMLTEEQQRAIIHAAVDEVIDKQLIPWAKPISQ